MYWKSIVMFGLGAVSAFAQMERVTAIIGAGAGGIIRSLDGGSDWESANNGLIEPAISALAASTSARPILYAAAPGSIYRSTDLGSA